jgi:2-iminoacetate synthase
MTTATIKLSRHAVDFIDDDQLHGLLEQPVEDRQVRDILAKSLAKEPLRPEETAALINADAPHLVEEVFQAARQLKRDVYGNRIVLFAPLYIGNLCVNDCEYCGFRSSNVDAIRCGRSASCVRPWRGSTGPRRWS